MMFKSNFSAETQKSLEGVSVRSGFPNPPADAPLENPDFNRLLIRHPAATFCMQISGNEWEERGIFDKDILVIDRATSPRPLDLVIYSVNGNLAVTRFSQLIRNEVWGVVSATIHRARS